MNYAVPALEVSSAGIVVIVSGAVEVNGAETRARSGTRARERVLHTFISRTISTRFSIVYYSQMDNVLLLNSGDSVVQLDTTDSGPRPHASPLRI